MSQQGHKHAALALQYWTEAAENAEAWKNWEVNTGSEAGWNSLYEPPRFVHSNEYRRKPQAIVINGIEVPEPIRKPLDRGEAYWIVSMAQADFVDDYRWSGDTYDLRWLSSGLVHRTKEAAEIHAKALLSFTRKEEQ